MLILLPLVEKHPASSTLPARLWIRVKRSYSKNGIMFTNTPLLTSGDIARHLHAKVQRVRHILATREHIRPVGHAGLVRLFDPSAVELVAAELRPEDVHETVTA